MKSVNFRKIDRKIRLMFVHRGIKLFYPEQFYEPDLSQEEILLIFKRLEEDGKLIVTATAYNKDDLFIWHGSCEKFAVNCLRQSEVTKLCVEARITYEYVTELMSEVNLD